MSHRILIALAEENLRRLAAETLRSAGHTVQILPPGDSPIDALDEAAMDVALVDPAVLRTPAAVFLEEMREAGHRAEVLYLVSYRALGEALGAMRAGAFGFVAKPIDWEEVRLLVERAAERKLLREEVEHLRSQAPALPDDDPDDSERTAPAAADDRSLRTSEPLAGAPDRADTSAGAPVPVPIRFELSYEPDVLVGSSPAVQRVRGFIARMTGTDAPILLEGPRGAGRTQVARAIHFGGTRAGGPLIEADGAELSRDRAELEFRGVARGAQAGTSSPQPGLIERAHGGTLIVRHPDFLPPAAQERLYGFLNSGVVVPVAEPGQSARVHVDTRLIFVSERPLERMIDVGSLIPELSRVLGEHTVEVPPLRSRLEDLAALARVHMSRMGWPNGSLEEAAVRWLEAQGWPGNLRQFEEAMRRAMRAMVEAGTARPLRLIDFSAPPRHQGSAAQTGEADAVPHRLGNPPRPGDSQVSFPTKSGVDSTGGFAGDSMTAPPDARRPDAGPGPGTEQTSARPADHGDAEVESTRSKMDERNDEEIRLPSQGVDLVDLEKQLISEALERTDGNQTQAARLLGLSRQTLIYRMQKYGIER